MKIIIKRIIRILMEITFVVFTILMWVVNHY